MIDQFKYNFVFFFAHEDYWESILGNELYNHPQVKIYDYAFDGNKTLQMMFKFHWSYSINSKIDLPFKWIWFKKMYEQKFDKNLPLCFVYMGGNSIYYDGGFTKYVRKQSDINKQIIMHNDIISNNCSYDYDKLLSRVDMASNYDELDAKEHGISYFCETTYSPLLPIPTSGECKYDVYFLGAAKDRLDTIMSIFWFLKRNGVKCLFLISGVKKEEQINDDGLKYIKQIPYLENIRNVCDSKCILEVIQGHSVDITTRVLEAICYRKKLISNCQAIRGSSYYRKDQMNIYDAVDGIDIDFIKSPNHPEEYEPLLDMNPLKRLYFFQEELEKKAHKVANGNVDS